MNMLNANTAIFKTRYYLSKYKIVASISAKLLNAARERSSKVIT
jgi:hypothetical protein